MRTIIAERKKKVWKSKSSKSGFAHARKSHWPVPDKGAVGKTPESKKWLKKPLAKISGEHINLSVKRRHSALLHAVIARGSGRKGTLDLFRELVALHNINPSPKAKAVFKADANWVGRKYGFRMK